MLLLVVLAACEPYVPAEAFADCTSERIDSAGVRVTTSYDNRGWPVLEVVEVDGLDPVTAETEYSRVAGRVVESLTVIDGLGYTRFYDAHEHLESYTTNGNAPDEDYECQLKHGKGESLLESSCTNGVDTTYDDCGNPDSVMFTSDAGSGEESWGFTYRGCQILSGQILGRDDVGPYAENFQYVLGREISRVHERDDSLFASFTTWDCPDPVE
ncbi:MAG: hypothetical protein R3F61_14740 [Myxococcota bacterium]